MGRPNADGGIRWHWTTPRAQDILRGRSLPEILVFYRRLNQLPLEELGALLGYRAGAFDASVGATFERRGAFQSKEQGSAIGRRPAGPDRARCGCVV